MKQLRLDELTAHAAEEEAKASTSDGPVHNFRESLARGEHARRHPFWEAAYRIHFSNMQTLARMVGASSGQRNGRDTLIALEGGEVIYVQEKARDRADDSDIALEYEHSGSRYNAPGWIELDLQIHYLAYAFIPLRRVYFFPWHQLQRAWREYGNHWKSTYRIIGATNNGYTSYCVCVPTIELRRAVARMCVVNVP